MHDLGSGSRPLLHSMMVKIRQLERCPHLLGPYADNMKHRRSGWSPREGITRRFQSKRHSFSPVTFESLAMHLKATLCQSLMAHIHKVVTVQGDSRSDTPPTRQRNGCLRRKLLYRRVTSLQSKNTVTCQYNCILSSS